MIEQFGSVFSQTKKKIKFIFVWESQPFQNFDKSALL